jgi:glycosyltransferase involved in cell wall biosynthesis
MKISIVIPVYNEVTQLGACLDAIAQQRLKPHEVIVVDNNSTDETAELAATYDFVSLLREPKQGVAHARRLGFDAATGDIIARIDGDTLLPVDWTQQLQHIMTDTTIDAVSGVAQYYNVAAAGVFNAIDLFFRRRLSRQLGNRVYLWGANMALRRNAWQTVRSRLCDKGGLHEDYDIAIHLQELGRKVAFDERLQAQVSSRRIDVSYIEFMRYVWVSPQTYARHGIRARWHMYSLVLVCAVGYLPARLLHRGYDRSSGRFSLSLAFTPQTIVPRIDPTANVA